jgi:hypothetical protein
MNYYSKYLKYKMKYIKLQKSYLIGGGKESAKLKFKKELKDPSNLDVFIRNLRRDERHLTNKEILSIPSDLDILFELFYKELLVKFDNKRSLDKYIDFIIKSYLNNTFGSTSSLENENIDRFKDAIRNYEILQSNPKFHPKPFILKRIDQFNGLTGSDSLEVYLALPEIQRTLNDINISKEKSKQASIAQKKLREEGETAPIFSNENIEIYQPKTEIESKYYGRNTAWCTAGDKICEFNSYNDEGPLYIIINKSNPKIKYQLHVETNSLMDSSDKPVELKEILNTSEDATESDKKLLTWLINDVLVKVNYFGFIIEKEDTQFTLYDSIFKNLPDFNSLYQRSLDRLTKTQIDQLDKVIIESNDIIQIIDILHRFNSLVILAFYNDLNIPLAYYSLHKLRELKKIVFSNSFNQPLEDSLAGLNILALTFMGNFNQPLRNSLSTLVNLIELTLSGDFNQPLEDSLSNLDGLEVLELSGKFNQPLGNSLSNLKYLRKLILSSNYNQPLPKLRNVTIEYKATEE